MGVQVPAASANLPGMTLKAWVVLTSNTMTVVKGLNIASVVKNATGDITITFTTAMLSADYTMVATGLTLGQSLASVTYGPNPGNFTTTVAALKFTQGGGTTADPKTAFHLAFYE